jgi:hypothetical protein
LKNPTYKGKLTRADTLRLAAKSAKISRNPGWFETSRAFSVPAVKPKGCDGRTRKSHSVGATVTVERPIQGPSAQSRGVQQ